LTSSREVLSGAGQQVGDAQLRGPVVQVGLIELPGPDPQDAQDIRPLSVGTLASQAIPLQFQQDDVLGGDEIDGLFGASGSAMSVLRSMTERSKGSSFRTKTSTLNPAIVWMMLKDPLSRSAWWIAAALR
jgi:hypothetical protein